MVLVFGPLVRPRIAGIADDRLFPAVQYRRHWVMSASWAAAVPLVPFTACTTPKRHPLRYALLSLSKGIPKCH